MSDSKQSMAQTLVISPTPRTLPSRASGRRRRQDEKLGAGGGRGRRWPGSCMARRNMAHTATNGGDVMQTIRWMALEAIIALAGLAQPATAQDKVKVGVFPTASSLPYFVA